MARLDYEAFKEYCFKNVVKALGEETYEAGYTTVKVSDDEEHESIQITARESGERRQIPSIRIKPFYLDYYDGKALGEVMLDIVKTLEGNLDNPLDVDLDIFYSLDKARDRLIIRPINYKRNKKLLADHVFRLEGDTALVLYTLISQTGDDLMSAKVTKKTATRWMIGEDYLMQTAMENTVRKFPPFIVPLEVMFAGNDAYKRVPSNQRFFMNPLINFSMKTSMSNTYYLSIDGGINGAVAVFYPGVLDRLCALFKDDLYITLNTIHDAFIHPASLFTPELMKSMAKTGPSNPGIDQRDFLSENAYVYRRDERVLKML